MALPWWQHHKHCRAYYYYYYYYYYLQSCKLLPPPAPRFNPFIVILKPQNNGPSYSNTVIGIHWSLMGGTLVQRGGDWAQFFPKYATKSKISNPIGALCNQRVWLCQLKWQHLPVKSFDGIFDAVIVSKLLHASPSRFGHITVEQCNVNSKHMGEVLLKIYTMLMSSLKCETS